MSGKRFKIRCKLLLFTRKKSHKGFSLVPKVVTVNDYEWRNGRYFALFHRIRQLCSKLGDIVVEVRRMPSANVSRKNLVLAMTWLSWLYS